MYLAPASGHPGSVESPPNPPAPRRLGLFGGSFAPVHRGHLHAARAAREGFRLDRVILVPARRPPHKPGRRLVEGRQRLAMLERTLELLGDPSLAVSGLELEREGPSYTIDTVRQLREAVGEPPDAEVFLILGSDNLLGLPSWRAVEELLRAVTPIVIFRRGDDATSIDELAGALPADLVEELRAGFLELPPVTVSSTDLRARLGDRSREGRPAGARGVVGREGLYLDPRGAPPQAGERA